jgi:transcription initiation factor TFIID subunit TAF12
MDIQIKILFKSVSIGVGCFGIKMCVKLFKMSALALDVLELKCVLNIRKWKTKKKRNKKKQKQQQQQQQQQQN